jgi:hypothetical protein
MNEKIFTDFVSKLKGIFNEEHLNAIGSKVGFSERLRVVTPYRVGVLLVSLFASRRVETIADVQRGFSALYGEKVEYKPFHNQLRKEGFAEFMKELVSELLSKAVFRVLKAKRRGALSNFRRVIIQDGSSFAVKDELKKIYPGRFTATSPAAVELHATYELFEESMVKISLRADTDSEQLELPVAEDLKGDLFLGDRGYLNLEFGSQVNEVGGYFIMRGKSSLNPQITAAFCESGRKIKHLFDEQLKSASGFSKSSLADLDVCWKKVSGKELHLRIVVFWSPKEKRHQYLVTNLNRARYSAEAILEMYGLRWQVELVFKEWKSYANLHAFDTAQPAIVEGFIWAAIAAAIVKRFFAHATQLISKVETSTRTVAMCFSHVLDKIVEALLLDSNYLLKNACIRAINYLAHNAKRAHPKRDRKTGRLAAGLVPVFDYA